MELMQGVEIINTLPIYETHWFTGLQIGAVIAFVTTLIGLILTRNREVLTIGAALILCFMLFGALFGDCVKKELIETRYEVFIDDTVDYDKFIDDYEFIEQRENSWIVKERNNEN